MLVSAGPFSVGGIRSAVAVAAAGWVSGVSTDGELGLAGVDEQEASRIMPSRNNKPGDFFTFLTINISPETGILTGI